MQTPSHHHAGRANLDFGFDGMISPPDELKDAGQRQQASKQVCCTAFPEGSASDRSPQ
jgi:hypothetical protein